MGLRLRIAVTRAYPAPTHKHKSPSILDGDLCFPQLVNYCLISPARCYETTLRLDISRARCNETCAVVADEAISAIGRNGRPLRLSRRSSRSDSCRWSVCRCGLLVVRKLWPVIVIPGCAAPFQLADNAVAPLGACFVGGQKADTGGETKNGQANMRNFLLNHRYTSFLGEAMIRRSRCCGQSRYESSTIYSRVNAFIVDKPAAACGAVAWVKRQQYRVDQRY